MSQINNVNTSQINLSQDNLNISIDSARSSRLSEVVQNAEVQAAQPPRVHRSAASLVGRVALGIVTVGISEAVRAIAHAIRGGHAQASAAVQENAARPSLAEVRNQHLEQAPEVVMTKQQLAEAVRKKEALPDAYQAAMKEAMAQLKEDMGGYVPKLPQTIHDLDRPDIIQSKVRDALTKFEGELTPQGFKELIFTEALKHVKDRAMVDLGLTKGLTASDMYRLLPGLKDTVDSITDVHTFTELLADINEDLDKCPVFLKNVSDTASNALAKSLGDRLGLAPEVLHASPRWGEMLLEVQNAAKHLSLNSTQEEIDEPIQQAADRLAQSLGEAFDAIDKIDVPQVLKDGWKNVCLQKDGFHTFCQPFVDAAKEMAGQAQQLVQKLAGSPTPQELAPLLREMMEYARDVVPGKINASGGEAIEGSADDVMSLIVDTMNVVFALNPELKALQNDPTLLGGIGDALEALATEADAMGMNQTLPAETREAKATEGRQLHTLAMCLTQMQGPNDALLRSIEGNVKKDPAPMHTQALKDAVNDMRALFPGAELSDNVLGMKIGVGMNSGKTVGEILAATIRDAGKPFSAQDLRALARSLICQTTEVVSLLPKTDERYGEVYQKSRIAITIAAAARNVAPGSAEYVAIIDMYKSFADAENIRKNAYVSVAERLGLPPEQVKQDFNTNPIQRRHTYMRQDFVERMRDLSQPMPTPEEFTQKYQGVVDKFVNMKVEMYNSIEELPLSGACKIQLRDNVLKIEELDDPKFITMAYDMAGRINTDALLTSLTNAPNAENVTRELFSIGLTYMEALSENKDARNWETNKMSKFQACVFLMVVDRDPAIVDAFKSSPQAFQQAVTDRVLAEGKVCQQEIAEANKSLMANKNPTAEELAAAEKAEQQSLRYQPAAALESMLRNDL